MDATAHARALIAEARSNPEKLNNVVELLELAERDDPSLFLLITRGLHNIFEMIRKRIDLTSHSLDNAEEIGEASQKLQLWANGKYQAFLALLLKSLRCDAPAVQMQALALLVEWLQYEATRGAFNSKLFQRLVKHVVVNAHVHAAFIAEFCKAVLPYDDLRTLFMRQAAALWRKWQQPEKVIGELGAEDLVAHSFELARAVSVAPAEAPRKMFFAHHTAGASASASASAGQKRKKPETEDEDGQVVKYGVKAQRKAFGAMWIAFLQLPITPEMYREVLGSCHEKLIPHMSQPVMLMDFLKQSYDIGGIISILSLHALFILITKHNLDYPDFYAKLYVLFEPTLFSVKYRYRFFRLAYKFLTSTHMPAYIIAAFVKKLARLCLTAPPHGALVALPIIYNLLKVLLHREPKANAEPLLLTNPLTEKGHGTDPYNFEEKALDKCNAIESSLWELQALEHHYHPSVARFVKVFENSNFAKQEFDLEDWIQLSYQTEFDAQMQRKSELFPVAIRAPTSVFAPEDRTLTEHWSFA